VRRCSLRASLALVILLVLQTLLVVFVIRGESLSFDEEDHMYSGYRMWTSHDYGLNPEHPPLVKLLAALPALGKPLWVPPLTGKGFKLEAMLGGKAWLEHNDGPSQNLVFRMRAAVIPLALFLTCSVFLSAREWFGMTAAVFASAFTVFDPNIIAHSGLVTTDIAAAGGLLASVHLFYRYVRKPSLSRLATAAGMVGLLLATKHSGVLIAPILVALVGCEIALEPKSTRATTARRLVSGLSVIALTACIILWAFYAFRYAARPSGLVMNPTLTSYTDSLSVIDRLVIRSMARLHLLPESYLMGVTDVLIVRAVKDTFVLGRWYPHSVWFYFPVVIAVKTSLGLMAAACLGLYVIVVDCGRTLAVATMPSIAAPDTQCSVRADVSRIYVYLLVPGCIYLLFAMLAGVDLGVRHILPLFAIAAILAGAGISTMARRSRTWLAIGILLWVAHSVSSLLSFPSPIAYSNELWGGPSNTYHNLSDSNVDWGQQLLQVKAWRQLHPHDECWFAYIVQGYIAPKAYGIDCHALPSSTPRRFGQSEAEIVPPMVHGSVLISATDMTTLWVSDEANPYREFRQRRPAEEIDRGVLVYSGDIELTAAAAVSRAFLSGDKLKEGNASEALLLAKDAQRLSPRNYLANWAVGDAESALGHSREARSAYQEALDELGTCDPVRAASSVKQLKQSMDMLKE